MTDLHTQGASGYMIFHSGANIAFGPIDTFSQARDFAASHGGQIVPLLRWPVSYDWYVKCSSAPTLTLTKG